MKEKTKVLWRSSVRIFVFYVLPVLITGIIRALAIYIFVTPNHFAPGGTNGLAVLLGEGTGWNWGYFMIIINVPIFFVAFFCLSKRAAVLSTASMLISSGLGILFDYIPGMSAYCFNGPETSEPIAYGLLGAVAGGIFLGIALAVMLRSCGTSGGTSVLASVVNKKWKFLSVSWLTFLFDAVVVFASFFVYYTASSSFAENLVPVLSALVSLFVTSKTSDFIIHGFKTAYKFEIVTNNPEELANEIMQTLRRGVTKVNAIGMYTHEDKSMLVCIIRKRQISELQRIIRRYPDTFAFFSSTSEVFGKFGK